MRTSAVVGLGLLFLLPSARSVRAQESVHILTLDASTATSDESVDTIGAGRYRLRAINLVPAFLYRLQWTVQASPIPPLEAARQGFAGDSAKPAKVCEPLVEAIGIVDELTQEKDVPGPLAHLQAILVVMPDSVKRVCSVLVAAAEVQIKRSQLDDPATIEVKNGQYLRVTLTRLDGGSSVRQWKQRYVAPRKGAWITSFGIAAIVLPDGNENRPHVAKGDSSSFTLTPKKRGTGLTAAPFVTYSWLPEPTGVSVVVSGGLGLDKTSTPAAFLGTGVAVNSNLVVSLGATLTQVLSLNGKYESGEVVTTNLTDDQINEKTWRVRPFVGLSWRFATNPFKAADSEVKAPAKPDEKPQAQTSPARADSASKR